MTQRVRYRQAMHEPLATDAGESTASEPAATGVPAVDAALQRLAAVEGTPPEEHVEIFDDVQRQLHDALADLDEP